MDFFTISKFLWLFAAPSHLLVWLAVAGVLLSARPIGRFLVAAAAAAFLLLVFVPVGDWAVATLENQYPRAAWPAHVDGLLELGGGFNSAILHARGIPGGEAGDSRPVTAFELARRYPGARIVFSGGVGDPALAAPETTVARYIFGQLGLPANRVLYENRARDTWENFVYSRDLAKPKPGETWLLVTSAYHLPRAMAVARQLGWPMQPWPSDYETMPKPGWFGANFAANLGRLDLAAHEWVGLVAYRLAGRAR